MLELKLNHVRERSREESMENEIHSLVLMNSLRIAHVSHFLPRCTNQVAIDFEYDKSPSGPFY